MSEEMIEVVLSHAGQTRRAFLSKLVVGSAAFAVPVIASFTIGGKAAPKRSPLNVDAGANGFDGGSNIIIIDEGGNLPDQGSNETDCGPNTMVDCGSNETDGGSNETDGGSNDLDGGSNDQDSGAGVPGGDNGGLPSTE